MGRKRGKKPSVSSYFTAAYAANPEWVKQSDNTPVLEYWKKEHGGEEMPKRVRIIMASVKSRIRQDMKDDKAGKPRRKPGRKPGLAVTARSAAPQLEELEVMIDRCIDTVRALNVAHSEHVLRHLRLARYHMVLLFDYKD